ncbi:hypothetical protein GQ457_12G004760 [Hibiscus cannabinus]
MDSCHTVSKVEGTFGYLPPEFVMHGVVDEKTDVYAFGVLLLELIDGRQAIDTSQQSIVMWAKPLIREDKMEKLVDPILDDAYDSEQLQRIAATSSICVDQSAANRPQMSEACPFHFLLTFFFPSNQTSITSYLKSKHGDSKQREKETLQRTYSEEIFDAEEYNSTKYLSDMNHQMEILLEQSNDG